MKKNIIYMGAVAVLGILAGFLLCCLINMDSAGYIPALKITGDVYEPYSLKSMEGFNKTTVEKDDKKAQSISLKDVVDRSKPVTESSRLLIIADDGLAAEIDNKNIDGCYIAFGARNGWEAINFNHPVSSNIKRIREILVVSDNPPGDYGVNIISPNKNIMKLTPGSMASMDVTASLRFEGRSTVKKDNMEYSTAIYTSHRMIKLSDLTDINSAILVMGDEGRYLRDDGQGYLEVLGNSIDYVAADMKHSVKNISGIMVDIPKRSVTDVYYDSTNYIEAGSDVLLIYLDGFGYHQYINAIDNGYAPYLNSLPEADMASVVYRPVTNAGFAAMITGKDPGENGVYSRDQKDMKVPSIFGDLKNAGKKSLLIEGNIKILNTEIEPVLNVDQNSSGSNDDEIFNTAMKNINSGYNFMLVHFHSIDESGTDFGDLDERTMNNITTVDGYIRELASRWKGTVIITCDHGIHSIEAGGVHNSFIHEDMIVPYIIISQ